MVGTTGKAAMHPQKKIADILQLGVIYPSVGELRQVAFGKDDMICTLSTGVAGWFSA